MTAKKITGHCEVSTGWHEDASGHPVIDLCRAPARYYKAAGPMGFGVYLCDEHKDVSH